MDLSQKCERDGCLFKKHSNIDNNNGLYCCKKCMESKRHGVLCERVHFDSDIRNKADKLISKIVLLDEKDSKSGKRHYRFGDIIHHIGAYWKESNNFVLNNDRFKDSILRDYIELCPNKNMHPTKFNYPRFLLDIVKKKVKENKFIIPEKNELVIHLRIGDYIDREERYLKRDYVKLIRDMCKIHPYIDKITICTAFHYGNDKSIKKWLYTNKKHRQNISRIRKLFIKLLRNINLPIDIKSSMNPDDDFVYMIEATNFIMDVGNFSKLILRIRNIDKKPLIPDCSDLPIIENTLNCQQ